MSDLDISALVYGPPAAGKTRFGLSAMYDFAEHKVIRNGRLLLFGRETNRSLIRRLPEECVKRFISPADNPSEFVDQFQKYLKAAYSQAVKGEGPEVFVLDGWTELDVLFSHIKPESDRETLKHFGRVKDNFIAAIQLLDPEVLRAHIITTARPAERKKGINGVGQDPEYLDFQYIPAMSGWAKQNISHYSDLVMYMEADVELVKKPGGKVGKGPVHKLYTVPEGDFWVKNVWEEEWVAAEYPSTLKNATFDDVLTRITTLQAETDAAAVGAGTASATKMTKAK